MRVLQDNGWDEKVKFIGFDASEGLLAGLRGGAIEALIVQDPVRMGYLSVVTMVKHLRGEKVESRIDTGVHLVTRDILDRPDIKQLVQPDLQMNSRPARGASRCAASRSGSMPPSRWQASIWPWRPAKCAA